MGEALRNYVKGKKIPECNLDVFLVSAENFKKGHPLLHIFCFRIFFENNFLGTPKETL